ncbi:MAG TPA: hypothetical protein VGP46_11595, partial [Acidimicrobiales bacterium]|nr:hypothetical protein [Acidimicrobiales bacterium]
MATVTRMGKTRRHVVTLTIAAVLVGALAAAPGITLAAAPGAAKHKGHKPRAASSSTLPSSHILSPAYSYDMVTSTGGVLNFGGAGWYGNEKWRQLAAPIVGMAVTPDGRGYW